MAVKLWFKYKDVEMQQGKAFFAFHVFDPINLDQVSEENRSTLLLVKNDIYALLGKLDKVKSHTGIITHPTDIDIATEGQSARAQMLLGNLDSVLLGNLDSAEASYEKAFGYLMSLESQAAKLLALELGANAYFTKRYLTCRAHKRQLAFASQATSRFDSLRAK